MSTCPWSLVAIAALGLMACGDDPDAADGTGGASSSSTSAASGGGGASAASTVGVGAGGSGGTGGDGAEVLTNTPLCDFGTNVHPLEGEYGHWAAARLTPPSYPFEVQSIRYELDVFNEGCAAFAHDVFVFVESAIAPSATPTEIERWTIAVGEAEGAVARPLTSPITLQTGEHLFIAVEMAGTSPASRMCIRSCREHQGTSVFLPERNYWSNATATPLPWADLQTFNLLDNYVVEALGPPSR